MRQVVPAVRVNERPPAAAFRAGAAGMVSRRRSARGRSTSSAGWGESQPSAADAVAVQRVPAGELFAISSGKSARAAQRLLDPRAGRRRATAGRPC